MATLRAARGSVPLMPAVRKSAHNQNENPVASKTFDRNVADHANGQRRSLLKRPTRNENQSLRRLNRSEPDPVMSFFDELKGGNLLQSNFLSRSEETNHRSKIEAFAFDMVWEI